MAESRRSFLESLTAYLASLPLLSAWLSLPAITCVKLDDDSEGDVRFPTQMAQQLADVRKCIALERIIRWIPVTAGPPQAQPERRLLIVAGGEVLWANSIYLDDPRELFGEITYYAEMPAPPSTKAAAVTAETATTA
jgi:hypothetical protein